MLDRLLGLFRAGKKPSGKRRRAPQGGKARGPQGEKALERQPPLPLPAFEDLTRTTNGELWTRLTAREFLTLHYSNLLDPRLHEEDQLAFLASVEAEAEPVIQALEREDVEAAQKAWFGDRNTAVAQAIRRAQGMRADFTETRERLQPQLAAATGFVRRHPAVAAGMSAQCAALRKQTSPSAKWLARTETLFAGIPDEERVALLRGLIAANSPPDLVTSEHVLRGIVYAARYWDPSATAPLLANYALRYCYDPRFNLGGEKLGNACLASLIAMPEGAGIPYLARILPRVKYPKIRARIDKALNEAAADAGISRDRLDELSVPTHDLDADGRLEVPLAGGRAILFLTGHRKVETIWLSPDGKTLKGPSAAMKADKEAVKALKEAAREIEADLGSQVIRLQRLYLEDRSWTAAEWRERYAEHPLLRRMVGALIWWVERPAGRTGAMLEDGVLVDVTGQPVGTEDARIRLWHPVEDRVDAVLAWRDRLESLQRVQPFAQAWREVYRLTDAERASATYTNRWAGHILKQHQCMALARANGWAVTHRMCVDIPNDTPWHCPIPAYGVVADYWVEGAGEPGGADMLDTQSYIYVSTDRLLFSRIATDDDGKSRAGGPKRGDVAPLETVPPVVFSEIMRHGDLFTSVASIASDPNWRDRGAEAEHPSDWDRQAADYWRSASFRALTGSAQVRRELLERILPGLAIGDRCSLDAQALVVRGKRHVYRIHLGSAAVQIAETRQHLCIVPKNPLPNSRIWLPFEGDGMLSIVLSKAALLAADDEITDPVILAQI